jgi:type IV pilus assembly protein PilV
MTIIRGYSKTQLTVRGFSLLELLVTMVVLAVGLLGIGLMQATALGFTKSAYWRTQAMLLSSDIADRIRANESSAASYVTTVHPTALNTAGVACIAGTACAGPAMAASDIADWSNRIFKEFAGGEGQILSAASTAVACPGQAVTTVPDGFMRVVMTWGEAYGLSAVENRTGGAAGGDCYQFDFVF